MCTLTENLRAARSRRGLSQQRVAEALHLPRSAVSDIERGARRVDALELKLLAELYGRPVQTFFEPPVARGGTPPELNAEQPAPLPVLRRRAGWRLPDTGVEQAVLDAAERLLDSVAPGMLEVTQVAAAAGVSRTTFYAYFGSIHDVIAQLLRRVFSEILDAGRVWTVWAADRPAELLLLALQAAAEVWHAHRAVLCSASASWHLDDELREVYMAIMSHFIGVFRGAVQRDVEAGWAHVDGDLDSVVSTLSWATERLFYLASVRAHPNLPDLDAAVPAVHALWVASVYRIRP